MSFNFNDSWLPAGFPCSFGVKHCVKQAEVGQASPWCEAPVIRLPARGFLAHQTMWRASCPR